MSEQHINNFKQEADFSIFADKTKFEHMIDLSNSTLLECVEQYILNREKSKPNIRRQYSQVKIHISNIEKLNNIKIYPIVIGDLFWSNFQNHLLSLNLSTNTVNNICTKICAVLRWSAKYGAKISPTLDSYQMQTSPKKPMISLSQDDVSRITYFNIDDLPLAPQRKRTLCRIRDQFVLGCFLGQRYSDLKRIDPDCFHDSIFEIVQQKTGNRAVVDIKKITAYPKVVQQILKKYKYKAPYPYNISGYNKGIHQLFRLAGFTDEIKYEFKVQGNIITKSYKFYELVSSHTARRTMITNCIQRGLHTEQVRRASGHTSESAFAKYVCWND